MNYDTLYIGTEKLGQTRTLCLPKEEAFEIWYDTYKIHLENMYEIFQEQCKNKKISMRKIDLKQFIEFVYTNSSKFISFWE